MNKPYTDAEVGCYLYGVAQKLSPIIVAVYTAGYVTGQLVHKLNDHLAKLF